MTMPPTVPVRRPQLATAASNPRCLHRSQPDAGKSSVVLAAVTLMMTLAACSGQSVVEVRQGADSSSPSDVAANTVKAADESFDAEFGDDEFDDDLEAEYASQENPQWRERVFAGNTRYTFSGTNKGTIKGETDGTASILYNQQEIDIAQSPWLNWRWKISNTFGELDERTRSGDDYPARMYVVIQTGALPWETKAINYVWSSNARIGDSWDNPFTSNAKMLVLQTGDSHVGKWLTEKRNVAADFKLLFNLEVNKLSGYAVMVDGDNSGSAGTGWFSHINFTEQ